MALGRELLGASVGSAPDVYDEGVLETAAATKLNFTGAGVTATDDGAGGTDIDIPGGAGTALYTEWDHRIPDVSPHALTDEFSSDTIAGYTTVYGNGDSTALVDIDTTKPGAAYFNVPSIAYHQHSLLKALPAGDFAIFTAVRLHVAGADGSLGGLILSTASTAGSGAQVAQAIARGPVGGGIQMAGLMTWNGFGATVSGAGFSATNYCEYPEVILRIRRVSTTVTRSYSTDGVTWLYEQAITNAAWTHFGIFFQNYPGVAGAAAFDYLRYYSSGSTLTTGGTRTVYA